MVACDSDASARNLDEGVFAPGDNFMSAADRLLKGFDYTGLPYSGTGGYGVATSAEYGCACPVTFGTDADGCPVSPDDDCCLSVWTDRECICVVHVHAEGSEVKEACFGLKLVSIDGYSATTGCTVECEHAFEGMFELAGGRVVSGSAPVRGEEDDGIRMLTYKAGFKFGNSVSRECVHVEHRRW